jgi:antitoxin YefM
METTYAGLRGNLSSVLDRVIDNQRRKGSEDIALIPAAELSSLMETAHLLRSPRNAQRLLTALRRVKFGKGKASSVAQLRRESRVDEKR